MATPLSRLLRTLRLDGESLVLDVTDDWLQGRSVFGGLQSAIAAIAMRGRLRTPMPMRTMQTTFIAPVNGRVRAESAVLREGKNTVQVESRLYAGSELVALCVGVFGAARASAVSKLPAMPAVDDRDARALHYVEGRMPAFLQHFDARWLRGAPPFSGRGGDEMIVALGLHDDGPCTEAHALAIADFIPPVALSSFSSMVPGSSVTWMIEFLVDRFDDLALDGWRVDAEMIAARDGYTNQSTMIWGPGGVPVAISRQSMVVFG